ncbi:helix-turn-helix transcriptional regulator [Lachnospiraceae bacterium 46-61]
MSTFQERLISLKQNKHVLQKDIADNLSISLRSYQDYEKGHAEPKLKYLIEIADYFDVSIDYLVGRSDDPHRY